MKIGDRVFVHGYVDEIRKDTVIIRNNGGYFGTIPSEIIKGDLVRCKDCKYYESVTARCTVRGERAFLIRGENDFCSRAKPKGGDPE